MWSKLVRRSILQKQSITRPKASSTSFHALNKTLEAEQTFQAALQLKPDHIPAYLTYGKLLAKNVRIFIQTYLVQFGLVRFGPFQFGLIRFNFVQFGPVWFGLNGFDFVQFGPLQFGYGVSLLAVKIRQEENSAKAVNYQAQGILNVLREAFHALNKTSEAERSFQAALEVKPDHIPAYLTYRKLLAKNVRIFS